MNFMHPTLINLCDLTVKTGVPITIPTLPLLVPVITATGTHTVSKQALWYTDKKFLY